MKTMILFLSLASLVSCSEATTIGSATKAADEDETVNHNYHLAVVGEHLIRTKCVNATSACDTDPMSVPVATAVDKSNQYFAAKITSVSSELQVLAAEAFHFDELAKRGSKAKIEFDSLSEAIQKIKDLLASNPPNQEELRKELAEMEKKSDAAWRLFRGSQLTTSEQKIYVKMLEKRKYLNGIKLSFEKKNTSVASAIDHLRQQPSRIAYPLTDQFDLSVLQDPIYNIISQSGVPTSVPLEIGFGAEGLDKHWDVEIDKDKLVAQYNEVTREYEFLQKQETHSSNRILTTKLLLKDVIKKKPFTGMVSVVFEHANGRDASMTFFIKKTKKSRYRGPYFGASIEPSSHVQRMFVKVSDYDMQRPEDLHSHMHYQRTYKDIKDGLDKHEMYLRFDVQEHYTLIELGERVHSKGAGDRLVPWIAKTYKVGEIEELGFMFSGFGKTRVRQFELESESRNYHMVPAKYPRRTGDFILPAHKFTACSPNRGVCRYNAVYDANGLKSLIFKEYRSSNSSLQCNKFRCSNGDKALLGKEYHSSYHTFLYDLFSHQTTKYYQDDRYGFRVDKNKNPFATFDWTPKY